MRFSSPRFLLMILLSVVLNACAPQTIIAPTGTPSAPPVAPSAPKATSSVTRAPSSATPIFALPTITTEASITCADLEAAWAANDWPKVLSVLQHLRPNQQSCETGSLVAKEYAAHFNYAAALEVGGQRAEAIEHYRAAVLVNTRGREALEALARLNALPTLPPPPCQPNEVPPYPAVSNDFITVADRAFMLNGEPFYLRGLNYYPRHAPWEAFLTSADMTEVAQELDLIAEAGFNTLRIALWYDPLFTCAPEKAVPKAAGFAKLDAVIGLARERGLRLIVTLNDLPDLYFRPLYTDYARYDAQTAFIVSRYRAEAAILAWDLRNEPDLDYNADGRPVTATSQAVRQWLTHIAAIVRQNDPHHLITVGWWGDAAVADEIVDFLSFHHWMNPAKLTQRIRALRTVSSKPIVLEEVGYPARDRAGETNQARALQQVISKAEENGIAGWLIWAAFDFAPSTEHPSNPEYFFGLWRMDLTPKPALDILPLEPVSKP
jgi:hypothetical protein